MTPAPGYDKGDPLPLCKCCGGQMIEADELVTGWNGHPSDESTGRIILLCEMCGEEEAR